MRGLLLLFSGVLALCLSPTFIAAQNGGGAQSHRFTEVPLLDCDGTPCIDATIGAKQKVRMGIDTGNVESVIDAKIATAAGLQPTGKPVQGAPGGMYPTTMPEVHVGDVTLRVTHTIGMDLSEMIAQKQMPRVDGTLAYTAFTDRIVELDYPNHKLRISEPVGGNSPACAKNCERLSLITFGKQGPPIVVADGFTINGKKVTAQLDTMYTGSLLVYSASIEKLGLASESKTQDREMFPLTDGGVAMGVALAKSETFAGIELSDAAPKVYFPTADVHEPDGLFDATVGLALLQNTIVTLDFHNMTIEVRKPESKT